MEEEEEERGQSQLSLSIWMTLDLSSYDFCGCETVYSTHMKPLISEVQTTMEACCS